MPNKEKKSVKDLYVIIINEKHVKYFYYIILKSDYLIVSLGLYKLV
jgi:hypothetical protein